MIRIEEDNRSCVDHNRNQSNIIRFRNMVVVHTSNLMRYIDKLVNRYTILPFLVLIILSGYIALYVLLILPPIVSATLVVLAAIGFSFTFDIRKNR